MKIYNKCVYSILHSSKLSDAINSGGSVQLLEKRTWRAAYEYLIDAKHNTEQLIIVFAPAENTNFLFSYGIITDIRINPTEKNTIVNITNLQRLPSGIKKTSLKKVNGAFIDNNYIRPYLLCSIETIEKHLHFSETNADKSIGMGYEEIILNQTSQEGKLEQVVVNRYERNPELRKRCIDKNGTICCICGFNFEKAYGDKGKGFIYIHHIKPLYSTGEIETDPINDLVPVCGNCHGIIHRDKDKIVSIEEMRKIINLTTTSTSYDETSVNIKNKDRDGRS